MIRRKDEFNLEKRPVGGGIGDLALRHKFTQEEMFGKCRLCAEITLEPGQTIGEHPHEVEFEFYYLLSGELVSVAEGGEQPFRQGDMMLTGGGARHAVRNDSNAPATILAIIVN